MNVTVTIREIADSQSTTFDKSKSILFLLFVTIALIGGISIYYAIDKPTDIPIDTTTDIDWKTPPCNPDDLSKDWKEVTNSNMVNRREFVYKNTGNKISFEKGIEGKGGFKEIDHWHRYNPNSTNKQDMYLDRNGNPVGKGSRPSHIDPKCN